MENYIIIAILAVLIGVGIRSTIKHFRHESGCCGGGTYKAKVKKLDNVIAKQIFIVEGMSCQNCVNRVMEAVNNIEGASAVVNLKKGIATVSMSREISDDEIIQAIEKFGYKINKSKG